ncbi:MGDG synthase family glycosyltransferase [Paenibacillus crassostreae]|uniref:UDP-N-acetylglucosamine--LPS N-acetylglucosamine transferase n=1 Tax=Paenibacillus crassostreae TaxID=1763538 RepID=A0A167GH93_9BACL|nr:glycosyltransferase [Paenibacillus crassostreae]AOZ92112.1 UDP-N-acetylglucosamine--LPS N-acetylglucosamine transferase [Paenibacillus crassostreae]OAB77573.1 UDP-N-acetylglucosamine--LPS N-acetylglucosamine transferase [Paenibacillus crassostreae]
MTKKRVLLLSEGFGAGHTQAAYALSSSLRKLSPDVNTKVMELGSFLNPRVAPLIITAYKKTITSQPRLIGMMYRHQYKKSLNRFTMLALHRIFYTHTQNILNQLRPDIIVCTHPIPSAVISRLKRLGVNIPLCTVITDYDAHGTWISSEVDRFLVSTPEVRNKLLNRDVPSTKIQVTGIPVHPNFWERPSKEMIREKFHLNNLPTVLVMSGGWGIINDEVINDYLVQWSNHIQIIFCLGNNEKSLQKMESNPQFNHPNIHLFGFVREIDQLMEISDVLVTKPGGMTCSEGLSKGIPMLFHLPIPGQEEENCQYFTAQGLGETISSVAVMESWIHKLIHEYPEISKRRQENLETIAKYYPMQSAQSIIEMLALNKVPS